MKRYSLFIPVSLTPNDTNSKFLFLEFSSIGFRDPYKKICISRRIFQNPISKKWKELFRYTIGPHFGHQEYFCNFSSHKKFRVFLSDFKERNMRDCLLVLCYDYGKGVPSCGFMTNEQFYNGGPTMNFFNAYASTEGYKSVVYPETLSGKGSDDICSLLMLIILASHSGQG